MTLESGSNIDRSDAYAFDTILPQCLRCKYWNGKGRCEAFPDGIPHEILIDEFDHKEPHPDDNGIQFEAKGEASD